MLSGRESTMMRVSTHAPARGATWASGLLHRPARVSTHAPARGATWLRLQRSSKCVFQPTRPRGARQRGHECRPAADLCFNPRALEGRDRRHGGRRAMTAAFQPTRPRGARRAPGQPPIRRRLRFNPRAREGRDLVVAVQAAAQEVSTHAPARGATIEFIAGIHSAFGFNPRAREGRDQLTIVEQLMAERFQPTRPRGARPAAPCRPRPTCARFNPRAREGRDLRNCKSLILLVSRKRSCETTRSDAAGHVDQHARHDLPIEVGTARTSGAERRRLWFATSEDQRARKIGGRLGTMMFNLGAPVLAQEVKAQAVGAGVGNA